MPRRHSRRRTWSVNEAGTRWDKVRVSGSVAEDAARKGRSCFRAMRSLDFDRHRRYRRSVRIAIDYRTTEPTRSRVRNVLGRRGFASHDCTREKTRIAPCFLATSQTYRDLVRPHHRHPWISARGNTDVPRLPSLFRTDVRPVCFLLFRLLYPPLSLSLSLFSHLSSSTCSTSISPLTPLRYVYPLSHAANLPAGLSATPSS